VLLCALRRIGLHDSDLAQATCCAISDEVQRGAI